MVNSKKKEKSSGVKSTKLRRNLKIFLERIIKTCNLILFWFGIRIFFIIIASSLTAIAYFYFILPPFERILDGRKKGSVTFLDKYEQTFAWRGQQFDRTLRSTNASSFLVDAIISSEDKNYFNHFGVSVRGIVGAIRINLREGRGPFNGHGGSTITQQVAKLLCLMNTKKSESSCRRQSIARKILELPFAIALEIKFSKAEILSIYMNRVYLGAGTIGFEAASQRYFNKSAREVSIVESAMLAALLKAPSRYAPTNNLQLAQNRAKLVLNMMLKSKYISLEEYETAIKKPATLSKKANAILGAHFVDWVMIDAPEVLTTETTEDIVIRTTFDPLIQKHVEDSVSNIFSSYVKPTSTADASVVVMSSDGDILAMLGGRKNTRLEGQYNRAFQAYRQPGSAFKPFVYAAALQQGYSPRYLLNDTRDPPEQIKNLNYWPKNHNNNYLGDVKLDYGLINSVNTVTVELAHLVGIKNVINIAKDLGIQSNLSSNLSLALGSSEVSLLNLTSAYAGFLNLGRKVYPRGWLDLRLKSNDEVLIKSTKHSDTRVIGIEESKALIKMLVAVVESGTGKQAYINGWNLAGKTGTSQNSRDAWFVGFTSQYVVGVWMGSDDNKPLKGVVGGNLPSKIWSDIIKKIHANIPDNLPEFSDKEYQEYSNSGIRNGKSDLFVDDNIVDRTNVLSRFLNYLKTIND